MSAAPSPAEFRRAMAELPTGVTVVTAPGPGGPAGATANAVTSLSLEPPLILACLDRGSRTLAAVQAAGRFGVNVLHAGQENVARGFSTKAPHPEKWGEIAWEERDGIPALAECLLWVAAELRDVIAAGDHVIVTGAVLAAVPAPGAGAGGGGESGAEPQLEPLLFWRGAYRSLGSPGGARPNGS